MKSTCPVAATEIQKGTPVHECEAPFPFLQNKQNAPAALGHFFCPCRLGTAPNDQTIDTVLT